MDKEFLDMLMKIKNHRAKMRMMKQGYIFVPYIIATSVPIISSNFAPKMLLKSRYILNGIGNR